MPGIAAGVDEKDTVALPPGFTSVGALLRRGQCAEDVQGSSPPANSLPVRVRNDEVEHASRKSSLLFTECDLLAV
jgi:hypothetical protein